VSAASPARGPSDSLLLASRGLTIGWRRRGSRSADHALASGIDLQLHSGDFTVLIGPNGAGKSTLLRTLVGAQDALSGHIELCGKDLKRLSVEERAICVATVFTDRFDSGYFSVYDIVAFGRYPYTDARNRLSPTDREAVESAIAAVGLTALAARRLSELSDGERQKTLIARAVAQDCPILVLDEPTAFLDAPARVEIFHLARRLARSAGKAVILSTHDVEHALRYADSLWLMDRAHRFEAGTPESLVLSGSLGRAFDGSDFRFDPSSGTFKSTEELEPLAAVIEGDAGIARTWTERLVERLGFAVSETGQSDIRIIVAAEANRPLWILRAKAEESRWSSIAELAAALTEYIKQERT
jgi:iron complex transport system ATP-binding protein